MKSSVSQTSATGHSLRGRRRFDVGGDSRVRRSLIIITLTLALSNLVLFSSAAGSLARVAPGLLLLLVLPTWIVSTKISFGRAGFAERLIYGLALTLLGLMTVGVALNFAMPLLGVQRALAATPMIGAADIGLILLLAWRPKLVPAFQLRSKLTDVDASAILAAAVVIVLAVAGAIRLNNSQGSAVTVVMLALAVCVFTRLFCVRHAMSEEAMVMVIYLLGLALLLMTSMRGWYTTGHDIQREYRVFELTNTNGTWSMARLRDAYNACLSITILPTVFARVTGIPDVYIYKCLFQALFATCPAMVYLIARRYCGRGVSILSCLYFVSFPTYFNDMPFLNRQEIAFIFLGAILLVITAPHIRRRSARIYVVVLATGMVVSHYSTSYVFGAVLVVLWTGYKLYSLSRKVRQQLERRQVRTAVSTPGLAQPVISLAVVISVVGFALLWFGPITRANSGLGSTVEQAYETLVGSAAGAKSSDVSYGLFSSQSVPPQQRLLEYRAAGISSSVSGPDGAAYYPESIVDQYETPIATAKTLPSTALGRFLGDIHIPITTINGAIRQSIAKLLQVLILIGFVSLLVRRNRRIMGAGPEYFLLGLGSLAIIGAQAALPILSVNYGLLRAFQQALFILAPILATGSIELFSKLRSWGPKAAAGLALSILVSTSGLLPKMTGNYPPQLNLDNAGLYYDIYYVHPQEVAGIDWLQQQSSVVDSDVQSEVQTDRYTFSRLQTFSGVATVNDIYPVLIRRDAFVFLGYSTVHNGTSTVSYQGDLITYVYPIAFLNRVKSLVYSNGSTEVYK